MIFNNFKSSFQIGEKTKHCFADRISQHEILLENSSEYWYDGILFGGKINKSSPLGKAITKMIDSKKPDKEIEKSIFCEMIKEKIIDQQTLEKFYNI